MPNEYVSIVDPVTGKEANVGATGASSTTSGQNVLPELQYNSTSPSLTNAQVVNAQCNSKGSLLIANTTPNVSIQVTPTVTASAYVKGYELGGLMSFANFARIAAGSVSVNSVTVTDNGSATANPNLVLMLFGQNPTNSTFTDHAALNIVSADLPFLVASIPLTNWTQFSATAQVQAIGLDINFAMQSGTTLYGVLMTNSTQTPGSTSAYVVTVNGTQH